MTTPRTRAAAIRRASIQSRRALHAFTQAQLAALLQSYQRTVQELGALIDQAAGSASTVQLRELRQLRDRITARMDALSDRTADQINAALVIAATLGTDALVGYAQPQALLEAATDAVRHVQTFRYADGLQLSDRIWRLGSEQRQQIGQLIESAVIQGHSASQAALDYINRGASISTELLTQQQLASPARLTRGVNQMLTGADAEAYRNALRVFRTEINRAHGEAYVRSLGETEGVAGVRFLLSPNHRVRDICDMHAAVNRYGMGPGVYPTDRHPWPAHPETISYLEVVFEDEITDEDRAGKQSRIDWLKAQPADVQAAVLGGQRKRSALQAGLLSERQITTPWYVLKARYEKQGVDVAGFGRG